MSPKSERPAPDAYDHLWSLLPVFIAFLAVIVFIAVADLGPAQASSAAAAEPAQVSAEPVAGY